jgi:DNA repair exonuclease SbcCD ATPase subunit
MNKIIVSVILSLVAAMPASAHQADPATPEFRERLRQEFKSSVETKRAELKAKIAEERDQLKSRLAKIRDERKKQTVEKISQRLEELNENRVAHFTEVLNKLDKTLERIISRTDKAASRGLDVSAVREAINTARTAIAAGRNAVNAQAAKVYQIGITTEERLRADVGAARQALHDDLVKVRDVVKAARDAVHNAAASLAKVPRVDEEPKE